MDWIHSGAAPLAVGIFRIAQIRDTKGHVRLMLLPLTHSRTLLPASRIFHRQPQVARADGLVEMGETVIVAAIRATANTGGGDTGGGNTGGGNDDPRECDPGFIAAANSAWIRSFDGHSSQEAGFWIVNNGDGTEYVPTPFTNETAQLTLRVPRGRVGLFHTHPNDMDPRPSAQDRGVSKQLQIPVYTGTNQGLWVNLPGSTTSQELRPGTSWTQACKG